MFSQLSLWNELHISKHVEIWIFFFFCPKLLTSTTWWNFYVMYLFNGSFVSGWVLLQPLRYIHTLLHVIKVNACSSCLTWVSSSLLIFHQILDTPSTLEDSHSWVSGRYQLYWCINDVRRFYFPFFVLSMNGVHFLMHTDSFLTSVALWISVRKRKEKSTLQDISLR